MSVGIILKIPRRDVVAMQCRQPSLEGAGEIPLRRLVKEALRMRPSRIIVGEVRQAESLDLLLALNSGLTVIAMTLIIGGLAVTSAQISRMRLLDAADAAALAATDQGAVQVYDGGVQQSLPLTDDIVRTAALEHLASRERPHGIEAWSVAGGTGSPDGHTAVVRLTAEADLPMVGGLISSLGGSVTVTVESRARADLTSTP